MTLDQKWWTVKEVLQWTSRRFSQLDFASPLLDAQLLLAHVLGLSKVELYMHADRPLQDAERASMRELVKRRIAGEPVAYLLNKKHWHELDLYVDPRVLIPRPETETLLDFVLDVFRQSASAPRIIYDFCTGSGCLAVALAKRFPNARVFGVDICEEALEVAKINARANGVQNAEFMLGDVSKHALFEYLRKSVGEACAVVANPPYVSELEWQVCDISVKDFEPKKALVATDEGLGLAKRIFSSVNESALLGENSVFGMEVGLSHCLRLHEAFVNSGGQVSPMARFGANTAMWKLPRKTPFALDDLTHRPRFWALLRGLPLFCEQT